MTGAPEYGKALFSLTEELRSTETVLNDMQAVISAMESDPAYTKLLDTPALPVPEKIGLIREAFGSVDESLCDLLSILCEKHAVHLFPAIVREYRKEYDEARGILRAQAITAVAMTDGQKEAMAKKLTSITGRKVILSCKVDPSILGGVKLRYSGVQLDNSVRTRLNAIENNLKKAIL